MILRIWRGQSSRDNADRYVQHVSQKVLPALAEIPGHRGATVIRRDVSASVEFLVITRWDSLEAIRAFAGPKPDVAVVEPEAQAVLSDYDRFVRHYEVAYDSEPAETS